MSAMLAFIGTRHAQVVCPLVQWIQSTLWERHSIRTLRRTLADFGPTGSAHLDPATGDLTIDGEPLPPPLLRAIYPSLFANTHRIPSIEWLE